MRFKRAAASPIKTSIPKQYSSWHKQNSNMIMADNHCFGETHQTDPPSISEKLLIACRNNAAATIKCNLLDNAIFKMIEWDTQHTLWF